MLRKVNDFTRGLRWGENITLKNAQQFRQGVEELIGYPENCLILNLANTMYINSAGLGVIAEGVMNARKNNKELVITELSDAVKEIFSIVKFTSFLTIVDSEQEAIEYFQVNKDEKEKQ
jgi:anti-sigma B factor antagonist